LLERLGRRMRIGHAFLDRPRPPTGRFNSFGERQRRVLMPRDKPVGRRRFVEQRRSKGKRQRTQNGAGNFKKPGVFSKPAHGRDAKNVSCAGAASFQLGFEKLGGECGNLAGRKDARKNSVTVFLNKGKRGRGSSLRMQRAAFKTARGF